MKKSDKIPENIDEYICGFPLEVQEKLIRLREVIKNSAPDASERISYQMPAFYQNGILVYYAGFKNHISFFPTSSGVEKFKSRLAAYETSKGTLRFQLNEPIPYELVAEIVKFRVKENSNKKK
ncbi:MAG: DUF1801 domain-containing protein [Prolixibacteraceae bacterium]|nr:DUF1801 domain-containing protein [Prolixibacteraceae bacterium]